MSELLCLRGSGGGDSQVPWPHPPEVSVGIFSLISSWNIKVPVQGQWYFGSLKVHIDPTVSQCDTLEL